MEKRARSAIWPVALKVALLAAGVAGQWSTLGGKSFMSETHWLYYTNQSNAWIMLSILSILPFDILALIKGNAAPSIPSWLNKIRFVMTVAITLTFVVFSLLLTPELIAAGQSGYLFSLSNICVHNLVPMLAIADWCLFGYSVKSGKSTFALGAIMPLLYVIFALTLSFIGVGFGYGKKVPYFFFDYDAYGWLRIGRSGIGVIWWILILAAVVLAMSYGLMAIKNARARAMAIDGGADAEAGKTAG